MGPAKGGLSMTRQRYWVLVLIGLALATVLCASVMAALVKEPHVSAPSMLQGGSVYPVLGNEIRDSAVRDKINQAIRRRALGSAPPKTETPVIEANSTYSATLYADDLLSLRFENNHYMLGAPHGFTKITSITIDLKTGKEFRLFDLFRPGSAFRHVINKAIKSQIASKKLALLRPFESVAPADSYYLTDSDLVIYYQLYDYTPYPYGIPEFRVPLKELMSVAASSGPLGRLGRNCPHQP